MKNYLDSALHYFENGMKVIPFWNLLDGKKSFPDEYAKYRESQTIEDLQKLFMNPSDGVCLLCTDGIEAVDIDSKHDPRGTIISDLMACMEDFDLSFDSVRQSTKSGGVHIIYKCPSPGGNVKLAKRIGDKEAVLETRGNGGLLFVHPTPGYTITSGDIFNIPTIAQEDRDRLIAICKHFDEQTPVEISEPAHTTVNDVAASQIKPLDDYNAKTDILQLVQKYGWTILSKRGDYVRLNRPNAKHSKGVDASVIVSTNIFYPFTSSEAFDPNKGYRPAGFYAISEHGGDFKAAAKNLYLQGYGERTAPAAPVGTEKEKESNTPPVLSEIPALAAAVYQARFKIGERLNDPRPMLTITEKRDYKIGGRGMIGVFTGHEKSGKSFVLSCIAASALKGGEVLNFRLNLDGGKMLWFDTEQSSFFFYKTQERLFRIAEKEANPPYYDAFHLRKMSAAQRLEVIEYYVYNTPGLSCLVIDGFVDLIGDYNDLKLVQEFVQRLMKWSDEKNMLILGVIHVNKGDGKIRGHIGSELKNKCDFVINTAKNESGFFTITNPTSRYGQFPDMDFTRESETGMPNYRAFESELYAPLLVNYSESNREESENLPFQKSVVTRPSRTNEDDIPF